MPKENTSSKNAKAPKVPKAPKAPKAPKEPKEPKNGKPKSVSKSAKAGLTFPIARVNRYMRQKGGARRVGGSAPVFLTAILEYVTSELMDVAGQRTSKANRKTISDQDVSAAVRNDPDLSKLFAGHAIFMGDKVGKINEAITYKPAPVKSAVKPSD